MSPSVRGRGKSRIPPDRRCGRRWAHLPDPVWLGSTAFEILWVISMLSCAARPSRSPRAFRRPRVHRLARHGIQSSASERLIHQHSRQRARRIVDHRLLKYHSLRARAVDVLPPVARTRLFESGSSPAMTDELQIKFLLRGRVFGPCASSRAHLIMQSDNVVEGTCDDAKAPANGFWRRCRRLAISRPF